MTMQIYEFTLAKKRPMIESVLWNGSYLGTFFVQLLRPPTVTVHVQGLIFK